MGKLELELIAEAEGYGEDMSDVLMFEGARGDRR